MPTGNINLLLLLLLLLPLALQPFVGFGFLNQINPSPPVQRRLTSTINHSNVMEIMFPNSVLTKEAKFSFTLRIFKTAL
jgi:hypothetical protein